MNIWISTGAFRTKEISDLLQQAVNLELDTIELSSGMSYSRDMISKIYPAREQGTRFLVHNYFPPPEQPFVLNIAAHDPEQQEQTMNLCRSAIELAAGLGAPFYSVHAGFAADLTPRMLGNPDMQAEALKNSAVNRDRSYQIMLDTVRTLADYAAGHGIGLLIENNVISPVFLEKLPVNPLLLTSAGEITRFMNEIDRDNVGMLLDTGHARVSATAEKFDLHEFMQEVLPHTRAMHLSDNDGRLDQNLTFTADAWFAPYLRDITDMELVIECYRLSDQEILQQIEVVKQCLS